MEGERNSAFIGQSDQGIPARPVVEKSGGFLREPVGRVDLKKGTALGVHVRDKK